MPDDGDVKCPNPSRVTTPLRSAASGVDEMSAVVIIDKVECTSAPKFPSPPRNFALSRLPTPSRAGARSAECRTPSTTIGSEPPVALRVAADGDKLASARKNVCVSEAPAQSPLWATTSSCPLPCREDPLHALHVATIRVDDPVGGEPLGSGELVLADRVAGQLDLCTVLLFSSGFYIIRRSSGDVTNFAWTPFTVINLDSSNVDPSNCTAEGGCVPNAKRLTMCMPNLDHRLVFTTARGGADTRMRKWMEDTTTALRLFRATFFPPFVMTVEPRATHADTVKRIMAGYLLIGRAHGTQISVVYCELQAPTRGMVAMAMYESERCDQRMSVIQIGACPQVSCQQGIDCSTFSVQGHDFCARTGDERDLWTWAINDLVQLAQAGVQEVSSTELRNMRAVVAERLQRMELRQASNRLLSSLVNGEAKDPSVWTCLASRTGAYSSTRLAPIRLCSAMGGRGLNRIQPTTTTATAPRTPQRVQSPGDDEDEVTKQWMEKWAASDQVSKTTVGSTDPSPLPSRRDLLSELLEYVGPMDEDGSTQFPSRSGTAHTSPSTAEPTSNDLRPPPSTFGPDMYPSGPSVCGKILEDEAVACDSEDADSIISI